MHHGAVQAGTVSLPLQQRQPYQTAPDEQEASYAVIPKLAAQQHRLQQHV
jgi:hypothetical protein